jgi:hypothetical protein
MARDAFPSGSVTKVRLPASLFLVASYSMWRTLYDAYAWFVLDFRPLAAAAGLELLRPIEPVAFQGFAFEQSLDHVDSGPVTGTCHQSFLDVVLEPRTGAGRVFGHSWGNSAHVFFSLSAISDLAGPLWLHSSRLLKNPGLLRLCATHGRQLQEV